MFLEQQINTVEASCDTEDWSNDAENSALITEINYIWQYIQIITVWFGSATNQTSADHRERFGVDPLKDLSELRNHPGSSHPRHLTGATEHWTPGQPDTRTASSPGNLPQVDKYIPHCAITLYLLYSSSYILFHPYTLFYSIYSTLILQFIFHIVLLFIINMCILIYYFILYDFLLSVCCCLCVLDACDTNKFFVCANILGNKALSD